TGALALVPSTPLFRSWATAGGALCASAALLVLPISSYLENSQFITDARSYVEKLVAARTERTTGAAVAGPFATAPLESAEPMATRLAKFAAKGPDVSLRFGLYPGDRLMEPLHLAVERLVIPPVLAGDAATLAAHARGRSA